MRKRRDQTEKSGYWWVLLFALLHWAALPGPDGPAYPQPEKGLDPFHWNWKNLLVNGGFEEVGPDLIPKGWIAGYQQEGSRVAASSEEFCSGRYALKITSLAPNDAWLAQKVRVKPNTDYRLSGWLLTRSVGPAGRIGANFSLIAPGFYHSPDITGDSMWLYTELNFRTHSRQREVTVAVRLGRADSPVAGIAYFDQVSLVELDRPPSPDHPHRYVWLVPAHFPPGKPGRAPVYFLFFLVALGGALFACHSRTRRRHEEE
jgi:hypothetical protein